MAVPNTLPMTARRHASTATALRPGEADTWLLRAAAERASGDEAAARASLERALGVVDEAPAPALARWLLDFAGDPAALAPLLPRSPARWATIVSGLAAVDPAAALTIATSRSVAPREAGAAAILEVQCATALVAGDAVSAIAGECCATDEITAPGDDADPAAEAARFGYLAGEAIDH